MLRRLHPRVLSPRQLRWLLNLYPPLFFQRVRVLELDADFRSCRVRIGHSLLTRNLNGSTFGGSIFSAADPLYAVLYWQRFARLGRPVRVWLRSAAIRYLKPARTALVLDVRLDDETFAEARATLRSEGRFARTHRLEAIDDAGEVCAEIDTEVYLRLPRADQREVSAF